MPPTQLVDMAYDDEDGMPPLVDNPLPPMTFTFSTQLPPITYPTDLADNDGMPDLVAPDMAVDSPPGTPMLGPARTSHAKKRDASYIPRPPNAFILFRSSFIRAQHIPGAIEGNHSALSKIIGKYWKALPRKEREEWETKAIVALAEHRQKYPDWRFKPAANALAKVKDGPRKRGNRKGRGQSDKEERSREKRCAKIADLLVAGKTGVDLAVAVEQYDCEQGRGRKLKDEDNGTGLLQLPAQRETRDATTTTTTVSVDVKMQAVVGPQVPNAPTLSIATDCVGDVKPYGPRSAIDGRFKVPLTAMFKRSSSAPASRARVSSSELWQAAAARRDSFSAAPPSCTRAASLGGSEEGVRGGVASTGLGRSVSREGPGHALSDSVSSVRTFSPGAAAAAPLLLPQAAAAAAAAAADGAIGVHDTVNGNGNGNGNGDAFEFAGSAYSTPPLLTFEREHDGDGLSTPALSPVTTPVIYSWGQDSELGTPKSIADLMGEAYVPAPSPSPSSYSSLEGWAGSPLPKLASPTSSPLAKVHRYVDGPDGDGDGDGCCRGVMEKAFDAAARAIYGDWREPSTADTLYAWGPGSDQQHPFSTYAFPAGRALQDDF